MVAIYPSARLHASPFYEAVLAEGMAFATVYNNMILPIGFGDPDAEYWRLINGVSQWDVGVERQVQLKGPDAGTLAQFLSCRDLSKCKIGQGKYAPLCNHAGILINDPVLLKHSDDLYWLSIADSDMWLWARAIAEERGLDVEVSEPDVSPMALQGPKAEDVVAHVLGDWVRDIKYFWFRDAEIGGIPVSVQRSGWSKQGGFEIYLRDKTKGTQLWNIFKEAGRPWDIGPGAPATAERTESGLLSLGGDTDEFTNPFEVRLAPFVDLDLPDEVVGITALKEIKAEGVRRHQLGIVLDGDEPDRLLYTWEAILVDGQKRGDVTNTNWSPRLKKNIGYALIDISCQPGDRVQVVRSDRTVNAKLVELPFI